MYIRDLQRRRYRKAPIRVYSPDDVWPLIRKIGKYDREHFIVLLLNSRNEVFGYETVAVGSLTMCIVHAREVFRIAIVNSCASIIVAHNHPSGSSEPSDEDFAVTKRLREAGELIGIPLLDHLIVAGKNYTSIRMIERQDNNAFDDPPLKKHATPEELLLAMLGPNRPIKPKRIKGH